MQQTSWTSHYDVECGRVLLCTETGHFSPEQLPDRYFYFDSRHNKSRSVQPDFELDKITTKNTVHLHKKQESPPAWTQEAYWPRRIKYSICCPVPGGGGGYPIPARKVPLVQTWLGGGGFPIPAGGTHLGYSPVRPGWGTTPHWTWLGNPPPIWTWPGYPLCQTWLEYSPGVNWQTKWKYNLPSRTTYAVGSR